MRKLVYTMFISNNRPSFDLWWKENLVKHRKVSRCYETDCRTTNFSKFCFTCENIFSITIGNFIAVHFKPPLLISVPLKPCFLWFSWKLSHFYFLFTLVWLSYTLLKYQIFLFLVIGKSCKFHWVEVKELIHCSFTVKED